MAGKKAQVVFSSVAHDQIYIIMLYIAEKGYPKTAEKFSEQLYNFGISLGVYPDKYPLCKRKPFLKRGLRCAPFKKYVFIYSTQNNEVRILSVIHSSRIQ